ncbi:MAG TPA: MauE/DoxX family redox-associated membrane protein [Acidimicrobiales bacterium]|nr:MauE/DoxX family redox-associated membrane protein [Acidimicrobiales bacterium]
MTATPAVAAPFLAAAVVLAGAGVAKMWRPDYTARAVQATGLRIAGRRPGRWWVRAGAAAELVIAVLAVALPNQVTGALVAAAYGAFATFVLAALARGWSLSSCGCFGRPDSKPGYPHVALNAGAAVAAVWWAVQAPGRIGPFFVHQPWHGLPLALLAAVIAGLAYLIWTNPLAMEEAA